MTSPSLMLNNGTKPPSAVNESCIELTAPQEASVVTVANSAEMMLEVVRNGSGTRAQIPGVLYESGKSQLSMRVPDDPLERFPAVVRAADILLAVTREAA